MVEKLSQNLSPSPLTKHQSLGSPLTKPLSEPGPGPGRKHFTSIIVLDGGYINDADSFYYV